MVQRPDAAERDEPESVEDIADVRGQDLAKRALVVAAAGGHSLLMAGPPGTGKTLLARRMPGLLPDLDTEAQLETALIASVLGRDRGLGRDISPQARRMSCRPAMDIMEKGPLLHWPPPLYRICLNWLLRHLICLKNGELPS